jgi:hypothetical protein
MRCLNANRKNSCVAIGFAGGVEHVRKLVEADITRNYAASSPQLGVGCIIAMLQLSITAHV